MQLFIFYLDLIFYTCKDFRLTIWNFDFSTKQDPN